MKLPHYLLISCAVGCGAGYFLAPTLLPALEQALYNRDKKTTTTEEIVITRTVKPQPKAEEISFSEDEIAQKEETFEPLEGVEEEEETEDDAESTDPKRIARYEPEDDGNRPVNEEHFVGKKVRGSDWSRPKTLEKRLTSQLRSKLKGVTPEKVKTFLKDPAIRLALAQWELLHRSDVDSLSALMKDKDTAKDLEPLLNDLRWISSFVYDGELTKPEIALAMLRHLRQCDTDMDKVIAVDGDQVENYGAAANPELKRRVAAAIAVEFTRQGWFGDGDGEMSEAELESVKDLGYMRPGASKREKKKAAGKQDTFRLARERYLFYKESIDGDLLNSSFAQLPDWLLHITCGWKGNSPFGTASTLRWLRDNCSTFPQGYLGICGQVPYRPTNIFGDSIFSRYYYEPFDPIYPGNFSKMTRDIGAVCGGVSHFSASAANANGVPAFTMGEPGHCAYAVYANGKWNLGFSIFNDHFPHYPIWGEHTWSNLEMLTAMYEQGARTRDAQLVATMAAVLESVKNINGSLKLYELSASMQPLNKPVWQHYIATAVRRLTNQPRKWLGVNEYVCSAMTPEHPEVATKFLLENIYPNMLKVLRTPQQKLVAYTDFFTNLNKDEVGKWDITKLMDVQNDALGKNTPNKKKFYQMVIDNISKHPEFGTAVTWVVKAAYAESKSVGRDALKKFDAAVESCENKDLLYAAVIRAAAEMGDMELFNKYSAPYIEAAKKEQKSTLPKFPPLPGNLISAGGLITLGRYHDDQSIITQNALCLTEMGGHIQSEAGRNQYVFVELPRAQHIGGVVIVPKGSATGYHVWRLECSMDGKEWQTLTELPDNKDVPYIRVQWKNNYPKARFLRVNSGSSVGGINFNAFLVYDNKKHN